jgi:hypothetical protein
MRLRLAPLLLCAAAAAAASSDPAGTVALQIEAGKTAPIQAQPGSNVICDDPAVAVGEFASDGNGFVLRAIKPGTTLCGVWVGNQQPGGLYRVTVVPEEKPAARDAGAQSDGGK